MSSESFYSSASIAGQGLAAGAVGDDCTVANCLEIIRVAASFTTNVGNHTDVSGSDASAMALRLATDWRQFAPCLSVCSASDNSAIATSALSSFKVLMSEESNEADDEGAAAAGTQTSLANPGRSLAQTAAIVLGNSTVPLGHSLPLMRRLCLAVESDESLVLPNASDKHDNSEAKSESLIATIISCVNLRLRTQLKNGASISLFPLSRVLHSLIVLVRTVITHYQVGATASNILRSVIWTSSGTRSGVLGLLASTVGAVLAAQPVGADASADGATTQQLIPTLQALVQYFEAEPVAVDADMADGAVPNSLLQTVDDGLGHFSAAAAKEGVDDSATSDVILRNTASSDGRLGCS